MFLQGLIKTGPVCWGVLVQHHTAGSWVAGYSFISLTFGRSRARIRVDQDVSPPPWRCKALARCLHKSLRNKASLPVLVRSVPESFVSHPGHLKGPETVWLPHGLGYCSLILPIWVAQEDWVLFGSTVPTPDLQKLFLVNSHPYLQYLDPSCNGRHSCFRMIMPN